MYGKNEVAFETLLGKTLSKIDGSIGDDRMLFTTNDGDQYQLYYEQD